MPAARPLVHAQLPLVQVPACAFAWAAAWAGQLPGETDEQRVELHRDRGQLVRVDARHLRSDLAALGVIERGVIREEEAVPLRVAPCPAVAAGPTVIRRRYEPATVGAQ